MTANEKWKIAILGELKSRSIGELLEEHIKIPCILLSSVEKKEVIEEEMVCPHCFGRTKISYPAQRRHTISRKCEHCGKEFENGCYTSEDTASAFVGSTRSYYRDNIVLTRANICGEDGLLYVELQNVTVRYNIDKQRVYVKPNIIGFGFAYAGGRYRYLYGNASRARTANYSNYRHPEFLANDSVFEFATEKKLSYDKFISERNAMRIMYDLELLGNKEYNPGRSILARKAQRFIDENPVSDLEDEMFECPEYLVLKLQKSDHLHNRFYYRGYCNSCGKKYSMTQVGRLYLENRVHKCPECGKGRMLFVDDNGTSREYVVVDTFEDKGAVLRRVDCRYTYLKNHVEIETYEKDRIYVDFSENAQCRLMYIGREQGGVWKARKQDDIPYLTLGRNLIITPKAEEFLKYTGFREYVDTYMQAEAIHSDTLNLIMVTNYLYACSITNCLEKISKLGWAFLCTSYAGDISRDSDVCMDRNGKTIYDVLKLPKRLVNYIAAKENNNPRASDVAKIQNFYAMDQNAMPEDLDWCEEHNVEVGNLRRVIKLLNISVHQAVEYLERVRISQCFIPKSAVIEWYDYLNASQNIQADLSDKTVRYPSSLKREHDRATFKYQVIKDKTKEERFQKICKEYGETYSYESEKFQIVAPKDMQDLFEEGRRLNHCVGSYADRIAEGQTCVCFIRKKSEPDQPYFTVEIAPEEERVRQIHGLSNRNVDRTRDHELFQFLKKWAKAKRINISAM